MAGGTITRIALGKSTTEIEEDFEGFYQNLTMYAGKENRFTARSTNHGTPKEQRAGKYFVRGWWTDDKDSPITEATIGDTIRFHVQTQNIPDGDKVTFYVYDWDGLKLANDKLELVISVSTTPSDSIVINGNKGYIEWTTGEGTRSLLDETLEGDKIELFVECVYKEERINLPLEESNYLIVKEKEEIITILIELPHSGYTDKLNRKGLGGHTGIIIGEEYYDFGPQPGKPFSSDGRPWWDQMSSSGNLTKRDVMNILNDENQRRSWNIVGKVCLIDIHLKESEKNKIENWWKKRYKELGTYSIFPFWGEQCTTAVRISIEKNSTVFNLYTSDIISIRGLTETTQTPEGFLELLTNSGRHTYGAQQEQKLTITFEYAELN